MSNGENNTNLSSMSHVAMIVVSENTKLYNSK